jgi:hypothetical protein
MGAIARERFVQLFRYQSCRLDANMLHPNVNRQVLGIPLTIANNNYGGEYNIFYISAAEVTVAEAYVAAAAQWNAATTVGTQDTCDNVERKFSCTARPNRAVYYENNAAKGSVDTSCELPVQTKAYVGSYYGGYQAGCLISKIKLWRNDK